MLEFRRYKMLVLGASTFAIALLPFGVSLGQSSSAEDKVPSGPTPLHAPMAPLTPEEVKARQGRGGGGGRADYNISRRSDFDKALPNPYVVNQVWYQMPKGRFIGGASAIDIDRDGVSVWVMERCGTANDCEGSHVDPIMKFSPEGKIQIMFGKDMINYPHGMYVDKDNNIWVTDTVSNIDRFGGTKPLLEFSKAHPGGAQVLKFSPQGKLLLRLGTPGVYGNDESHFSEPSDVVTDAQGNIYVADGHDSPPANNRIVKFDKSGKYLKSWNSCQPWQARQIDCGHSINIDSQGRIFVANRANDTIEIFDQEGKLLAEWLNWGKSSGLFIDKNDIMYSSDSQSGASNQNAFEKGVHIGSAKTGEITAFIPDPLGNSTAWQPGGTLSPEGVAVDKDGRIYTSSVRPPGLMRWTLTENTPPVKLFNPNGRGGRGAAVE
jgi:DNA-binding beta-propeller fold protein YncE